jgi:hypothetical protein
MIWSMKILYHAHVCLLWSLSWTKSVQFTSSQPNSVRSLLLLSAMCHNLCMTQKPMFHIPLPLLLNPPQILNLAGSPVVWGFISPIPSYHIVCAYFLPHTTRNLNWNVVFFSFLTSCLWNSLNIYVHFQATFSAHICIIVLFCLYFCIETHFILLSAQLSCSRWQYDHRFMSHFHASSLSVQSFNPLDLRKQLAAYVNLWKKCILVIT